MTSGFSVEPGGLEQHAAQVAALAGRVRAAAAAGGPLDHGAYGLVGQVFAVAVTAAADAAAAAVAGLAARADGHASALRASATGYRQVEQATTAGLGGPR